MLKIKYPLLAMAVFWIIGLILGTSFSINIFILFGAFILLFLLSLLFYYQKRKIWLFSLLFAIILLAMIRMDYYQLQHESYLNEVAVAENYIGVRGYIDSVPIIDGDLVKFSVEPISYSIDGQELVTDSKEKILVYLRLDEEKEQKIAADWKSGMGINLTGKLSKPKSARNPGQFDYQKYLMNKGIYWTISVEGISQLQVSDGSKYSTGLNSLRFFLGEELDKLYPEPQAGFMKAIILGDRESLEVELEEDFSILGLSHLLAISGLHLSILTMMLYWSLTRVGISREKTTYIISSILLLYMLLTGASASVVRATIMTLLMLYSFSLKKYLHGLQNIAIALILMTFYQPTWIYDIGFQLSFTVTFFILWGYKYVYRIIPLKEGVIKNSLTLLAITQLASFPLSFYYFNHYSLLSIMFNLLIVPLFSLILPIGIISLIFGILNLYIGNLIAFALSQFLDFLFAIIHNSAKLTNYSLYGGFDSALFVVFILLTAFWLLFRTEIKLSLLPLKNKKVIFLLEKILLLAVLLLIFLSVIQKGDQGIITFIDVGQGDSILIETPDDYVILMDSGGNPDYPKESWQKRKNPFNVGEDIVLPFLRSKGINNIDMAVLTHEDIDHMGGFLTLIDQVNIDLFVVPSSFPRTDSGKVLEQKLQEKEVALLYIDDMKSTRVDQNTSLTFVPVEIKTSAKGNDHTFVTQLNMYNTTVFFSSDLENAGENLLLSNYKLKKVDILKIGHHGSNTSTTDLWLNTLNPKQAIISVGENNQFGHPAKEVIERLGDYDINIWRTDSDGAIVVYVYEDTYDITKTINGK